MIFVFDEWELDPDLYELRRDGRALKVEPQVFDLLLFLVVHRERVVTREEIVAAVWGGRHITDETIATCIKSARRVIGDDGLAQRFLQTVRGRGFRFVGEVTEKPIRRSGKLDATDGPLPREASGRDALTKESREKPILAVLPFDNLSSDVDAYFADGLTEDIITNLARFRELQVIARTSTFQFRGSGLKLSEFCAELNADYVVEGSVRRSGDRLRITAQLIDARSGVHLWADHFDREMADLFAVQDEVTRLIAAALGVKVQDAALQRALRKSTTELDAHDCVLRARRFTSLLSAESHAEARDLLERAIALDPGNADAHALLANVYLAEHRFEVNPRPDPIGRAMEMALTATRLDPQNAYARTWLAVVYFFRGENEKFEEEAQRALSLNPSDPEILADIGHFLAFMGEFERGTELSRRAQLLNPLHPGWYFFSFARLHYHEQEYEETLADIERIAMPGFYWTHLLKAAALGQLGRPEAAESLSAVLDLKPDFDARAELRKWNVAPKDVTHVLEGLQKAGLQEDK